MLAIHGRLFKKTRAARSALALLVCLVLSALATPARATAAETETVVRVGWHEPPYYITDELGRRMGYSYEYQQKISAYTGWQYEYVEGSWSELLGMLKRGEIDLMGNISYTAERAESILYASLPMGTEAYYVFVAPDETEIRAEDYASLNGKRVGVAKDSFQSGLFREWTEERGVSAELVELTDTEEESLLLLGGELDAYVTMDVYGDPETAVPVWKIGSSDFYFAVSRERPDLLAALNDAMNRIQDENKYYNQQLHERYLRNTETDLYLNDEELAWLNDHDAIRVGYQDDYLAFCASDGSSGELVGALADFLDSASTALENAELSFETVAYPTAASALEALQNGEVDCMFPANLTAYDSETLGVVMTPALMTTEMDAVVRAADQKEFIRQEQVTVAVNRGNTNYDMFLIDHFPTWEVRYYNDTPTGLKGVAVGEADCVILSNYRYNNIAKLCERLHLTTVYTGVDMDYSFAVRRGDTTLYSILAKVIAVVPDSVVHAALTYHSTEDARESFFDVVMDNLASVLLGVVLVALVILFLLLRSIRAERKAMEEERLVNVLNKRVFIDALTSVRNKGAFFDAISELQDRMDQGDELAFAVGVFDCDDLKVINDGYGHDKGDAYLKAASGLITRVFQHSPVFRIGGDEFAVILQDEDYQNSDELFRLFRETRAEICAAAENPWDEVNVTLGLAEYEPGSDASVIDVARRADKLMYENKRLRKEAR